MGAGEDVPNFKMTGKDVPNFFFFPSDAGQPGSNYERLLGTQTSENQNKSGKLGSLTRRKGVH